MQANPDKFQVLAVGKKTFDKNMKICIQNSTLSCEETIKLLGIEIDYQLNFDIHISSICRKASQQLNILKRLGRYLDRLSKLTIFHTFILSNFNFCPLAWHFCTDKNSKKLEKVQERALRFVYNDYTSSYINLLEKALVPSLQIRRIRTMALETYKIVNKLAHVCLHDLVNVKNSKYAFRYSNILDVQKKCLLKRNIISISATGVNLVIKRNSNKNSGRMKLLTILDNCVFAKEIIIELLCYLVIRDIFLIMKLVN
jgi:hypothetical protein